VIAPIIRAAQLSFGLSVLLASGPVPPGTESTPADSPNPALTITDPRITESSGLAVSARYPDRLWTMNDSGGGPEIFALSRKTGKTLARVRLRDADRNGAELDVRDVEALAPGPAGARAGYLWLADIGDNSVIRDTVVLRLLREPSSLGQGEITAAVHSLRLKYPAGAADAEALVWTPGGRLLIITKGILAARILEVPEPAVQKVLSGKSMLSAVLLRDVGSLSHGLITDATALADGRIVIRDYSAAWEYKFAEDKPGNTKIARGEELAIPRQPQGESLAVEPGSRTLLAGSEGVSQALWRISVSTPRQATQLPLGLGEVPGGGSRRWLALAGIPVALLVLWRILQVRRRRSVRLANRAARRDSQYTR
jgi:hypothetical protein